MKNVKSFIFIFLPIAALTMGTAFTRHHNPISLFLALAQEKNIETFKIQLFLDGQDSVLETINLTSKQKQEILEILTKKDEQGLVEFSKSYGKWEAVVGIPKANEKWPAFLGGGWMAFWAENDNVIFGNLSWPDRLYLALNGRAPLVPPFSLTEIKSYELTQITSKPGPPPLQTTPSSPTPKGVVVRVEIQNGCGITGAADWAARRLKGPGIIIANTGNADNFSHSTTVVKTSIGVPESLSKAMERLGLSKDSVEELPSLANAALANSELVTPVNVVVIVGKDFRKLKERSRDRRHH